MLPLSRTFLAPFLLVAVASAADSATGLPKQSPFAQRLTAGAPAAASETIELAGISTVGTKTDLIFYDKTTKKNHWIAKGETKEGISVLNFDPLREEAVVKINGVQKTLPLRKVASSGNGPRPVAPQPTGFNTPPPVAVPLPAVAAQDAAASAAGVVAGTNVPGGAAAPAAPTPPATPETTQAKQETEARMLVSDLLEIGMAQRRAYEEAQRKAASGTSQSSSPVVPDASKP